MKPQVAPSFHSSDYEDWKTGRNLIGATAFKPDPETGVAENSETPELSLAVFDVGSGKVLLPETVKNKWLHDNLRKEEWQKAITEFEKL